MRQRGIVVALVLAVGAAGMATVMITNYLRAQARLAREGSAMAPVVVSVADLSFGRTLAEQDLAVALYPVNSVPKGAVAAIDSLVGQTTKVFLARNEPVLVTKLSSIGGGLSLRLPADFRGVSLLVNNISGVSGFVLPGDRVDVIAVVAGDGSGGEARSVTIMQNVEVLAAGQETEKSGTAPLAVQSITLVVDQAGAEVLALAANEGKLSLSLRNPNDTQINSVRGLTRSELLPASAPAAPATSAGRRWPSRRATATTPVVDTQPPPPATPRSETLTIIRGTDTTTERPTVEASRAGSTNGRVDTRGPN
jgi:pilus assembly protein CpaB